VNERHLELQEACFKFSNENFDTFANRIHANDYVDEVLGKIANSPHQQILISATTPESLIQYLQNLGIEKFFPTTHAFAIDTHRNRLTTKKKTLQGFLESSGTYESIVAIGDSPKDVELAKIMGNGISYLYAHPKRSFRDCDADNKINDLREILREI